MNMQQFKRGDICKMVTPLSKKRTPDYSIFTAVHFGLLFFKGKYNNVIWVEQGKYFEYW